MTSLIQISGDCGKIKLQYFSILGYYSSNSLNSIIPERVHGTTPVSSQAKCSTVVCATNYRRTPNTASKISLFGLEGYYTVFRKKTPTRIFFHISMSDV